MKTEHDKRVGSALRDLDAPAHRADFFDDVWQTIADLPEQTDATALRRRSRWARLGGRRLGVLAAAAAVVAAAIAVGLFGLPGLNGTGGPAQASAAQRLLERINATMASTETLKADFWYRQSTTRDGLQLTETQTGTLVITALGDERLEGDVSGTLSSIGSKPVPQEPHFIVAYDARRRVLRQLEWGLPPTPLGKEGPVYTTTLEETTDYGPGPSGRVPYRADVALVRAMLAEASSDLPVRETTYEGRPSWEATFQTIVPAAAFDSGPAVTTIATVDQQTGLVVSLDRVQEGAAGIAMHWQLRLTALQPGVAAPRSLFTISPPKGKNASIDHYAGGFHVAPLAAVQARLGFPVYAPDWAPRGYAIADTASLANDPGNMTVRSKGNETWEVVDPDVTDTVAEIDLRRGFDILRVYEQLKESSDDALTSLVSQLPHARVVTLRAGAFRGCKAITFVDPMMGEPGLEVTDGTVQVDIWGDATRDELVRVAESLQPVGD